MASYDTLLEKLGLKGTTDLLDGATQEEYEKWRTNREVNLKKPYESTAPQTIENTSALGKALVGTRGQYQDQNLEAMGRKFDVLEAGRDSASGRRMTEAEALAALAMKMQGVTPGVLTQEAQAADTDRLEKLIAYRQGADKAIANQNLMNNIFRTAGAGLALLV